MLPIPSISKSGNGRHPGLVTTSAAIDALGGTMAVARLTGRVKSAPFKWRKRGRFPPATYLMMTAALAAKGVFAPAWLWSQEPRPPAHSAKAEDTSQRDDLWSPSAQP